MQGLDAVPAAWCRPGSITSHSLEPRSTPRTTFTHFYETNQQIRNPKSNLRRLTTQYKHPKPRTSTSSSAATRQQHRNQTNHQPHRAHCYSSNKFPRAKSATYQNKKTLQAPSPAAKKPQRNKPEINAMADDLATRSAWRQELAARDAAASRRARFRSTWTCEASWRPL